MIESYHGNKSATTLTAREKITISKGSDKNLFSEYTGTVPGYYSVSLDNRGGRERGGNVAHTTVRTRRNISSTL